MAAATFRVREIENLYVPMRDGVRLAARAWLPDGAPPAPAVVEYLPYRKRDATRPRDETIHPVLAAAGHPALRVDVRGTGDADGLLLDEYHPQEVEDGVALLAWVGAQPWCDGRVVLLGKSWGGMNALMIAAHGPPHLAGVVSVCATDDRYGNDAHYLGGRLLVENLIWGVGLMAVVAHPPDPRLAGAGWREAWRARLEAVLPFPALWMAHPRRDAYWQRDAVCERAGAIACPVLLFGGLDDPYRDAIPRLLAGLGGPRRAVVGPWAHLYPHLGRPGPALDFPGEVLRWMARHLGPHPCGEADLPALLAFRSEGARPADGGTRAGRWVAVPRWPPTEAGERRFVLDGPRLVEGRPAPALVVVDAPAETGLASGGWCRFGQAGEGPYDQREDDARSVCFDGEPLEQPLEVLGTPVLRAARARPWGPGLLCARLCEVLPDGRSECLAYGLLDLEGVGETFDVPLQLTSHRVRAGSRLRLALSNALWPIAWPSPGDGPVVLRAEACALHLPLLPGEARTAPDALLPPPEGLPPAPDPDAYRRTVSRDAATGAWVVHSVTDVRRDGAVAMGEHPEIRLEHGHGVEETFTIVPGDRASARAEVTHRFRLAVPGLDLRASVTGTLRTVEGRVVFEGELKASENGRTVALRRW